MLANPAASSAAAAEAPAGTITVRPSTMTRTVSRESSSRDRNIDPLGRKEFKGRVERAPGDHRREEIGMRRGEGDTAVTIGGEGTGEALRLVVDRQPIGWHDPQCRPGAHDLHIAQPREGQHSAAGNHLHHGRPLCGVETRILLAVAQHDAALDRLADCRDRHRQNVPGALGDQDLPFQRLDRSSEPELSRQVGIAEPGGEHDLRRANLAAGEPDPKVAGCGDRFGHRVVRKVASAVFDKALMQRMEEVERVGMAVIRRPRRTAHRWPEARKHVHQLAAIDHTVVEAEIAGLRPHPLHQRVARLELTLAETKMQPTRPLVAERDPGLGFELGGERGPLVRRVPCPALVMGRAVTLALYPSEPEIAARGAEGYVTLVGERHPQTRADEPIGDRRADQPAADYDRIVALHLVTGAASWSLEARRV